MAQNRCSGEEAFRLLVRTSQNRNLKLSRLAEQLVDSVAQPPATNGTTRPPPSS
jgi:AmiR/NasT family two-component response regulator